MSRMIALAALLFLPIVAHAEEKVFLEMEKIYLTVLTHVVKGYDDTNRLLSVAVAQKPNSIITYEYVPLPTNLWNTLRLALKTKEIDVAQFVPADQVEQNKERTAEGVLYATGMKHKSTGKPVWVYCITGITWRGDGRLYVKWQVYNGPETAGGSCLVLEKQHDRWVIVQEEEAWVS